LQRAPSKPLYIRKMVKKRAWQAQKIIFFKKWKNRQELLMWLSQKNNFGQTDVRTDVRVQWRQYPIRSKLRGVKMKEKGEIKFYPPPTPLNPHIFHVGLMPSFLIIYKVFVYGMVRTLANFKEIFMKYYIVLSAREIFMSRKTHFAFSLIS